MRHVTESVSTPGPDTLGYGACQYRKLCHVRALKTVSPAARRQCPLRCASHGHGAPWLPGHTLIQLSASRKDQEKLVSRSFAPEHASWHLMALMRTAARAAAVAFSALSMAIFAAPGGPPCHHGQSHPSGAAACAARVAPDRSSSAPVNLPVASARPAVFASVSVSQSFRNQYEGIFDAFAYVNYKILQALTFPTWGKLLTVLAVLVPVVAAGSWALCAWTGLRPGEALLRCYLILNNVPGVDITNEPNPRAAFLMNVVYTVGLLTFAALIGVLGEDISSAVEAARLGNSRVPERNHTVVLGHNRQLVEVLRQVALVRADRGAGAFPGQLVVLSHMDRGSLERVLVDNLGPAAAAGVVTRQGSPLKVCDLERVSAGHARTVIMLAPEPGQEDDAAVDADDADGAGPTDTDAVPGHILSVEARQSVTLAALHHLRQQALRGPGGSRLGAQPQTVVVQHDADLDLLDPDVFTRPGALGNAAAGAGVGEPKLTAGRHLVTPVSHLNSLSRIQAQCASQPGLSVVMGSIMQQQPGMPEFYVQRVPEVVGLTYGEARRLFPRAVLCGVYDPPAAIAFAANSAEARLDAAAKAVVLNPPDSMRLQDHYSLVLLADRTEDLRLKWGTTRVWAARRDHPGATRAEEDTTASWAVPQELRPLAEAELSEVDSHRHHQHHRPRHHLLHRRLHALRLHALHLRHHRLHARTDNLHEAQPAVAQDSGALLELLQPQTKEQQQQQQRQQPQRQQPQPEQMVTSGPEPPSEVPQGMRAPRGFWTFGRRSSPSGGGAGALRAERLGVQVPGTRAERGAAPVRVVVLAFNGQQPEELLDGLADYCPPGSQAVVVAREDTPASRGPPASLQQQKRLRIRTIAADPRTRGSLNAAGAQEADAVILTGLEGASTDRADAQSLATLLQLQALMPPLYPAAAAAAAAATAKPVTVQSHSDTSSYTSSSDTSDGDLGSGPVTELPPLRPPLNLVCSVTDPRVREIMFKLVQVQSGVGGSRRRITIETINSDELLAGVLTQVAAEPRLSGLFHELSSAEGVEVHLRSPSVLELPYYEPLTWQQVQETGREKGVTVIGLLRAGGGEATQPRLSLGVPLRPWGAAMEFRSGDKVVVLSGE